ncbi:MAG: hypothetical protein JXA28_10195 [Bacteroidetes bacterium]|nr:hypothetical protein [Bacteroidota bacterium]
MKTLSIIGITALSILVIDPTRALSQTALEANPDAPFNSGGIYLGSQNGSQGPSMAASVRFAHDRLFFLIQGRWNSVDVDVATVSLDNETHQDYSILAGYQISSDRWAFHIAAGPALVRGKELGAYRHTTERRVTVSANFLEWLLSGQTTATRTVREHHYAVNSYAEAGGVFHTGVSVRLTGSFRIALDVQALSSKSHRDVSAGLSVGIGTL